MTLPRMPRWLLALLVVIPLQALGQGVPPAPCATAEHRQFDFWVGEWEVFGADGKLVGTNTIGSAYGGCVLHEQYATPRGYSGASFNMYDAGRDKWHQTWVDNTGVLLQLDGGLVDGRMVLAGEAAGASGSTTRHRITWTPNPDGSVRQFWESTNAAGEWTVAFDGRYVRRAASE